MSIFYQKKITEGFLSKEESRHCIQALRYQKGDLIQLYDGGGGIFKAKLTDISKDGCRYELISSTQVLQKKFSVHLAIAPTKNMRRMEWMVEKLCEIGADQVNFIKTERSERKKMRSERLENKVISAMKQSGNPYLTQINKIQPLKNFIKNDQSNFKIIACTGPYYSYLGSIVKPLGKVSILIGPEGGFSMEEFELCKKAGYQPASLGKYTLRTETAGFMACCIVNAINNH